MTATTLLPVMLPARVISLDNHLCATLNLPVVHFSQEKYARMEACMGANACTYSNIAWAVNSCSGNTSSCQSAAASITIVNSCQGFYSCSWLGSKAR
jgi:hypothetical protein